MYVRATIQNILLEKSISGHQITKKVLLSKIWSKFLSVLQMSVVAQTHLAGHKIKLIKTGIWNLLQKQWKIETSNSFFSKLWYYVYKRQYKNKAELSKDSKRIQ
jgi:hypothetical protein